MKTIVASGAKPSVRVWTKTSVTVVSHSSHRTPLIKAVVPGPKLSIKVDVTSSVIVLSLVQEVVASGMTAEIGLVPITADVMFEASVLRQQAYSFVVVGHLRLIH